MQFWEGLFMQKVLEQTNKILGFYLSTERSFYYTLLFVLLYKSKPGIIHNHSLFLSNETAWPAYL